MDNSNHIYGRGTNFGTSEPVESNPELEAVRKDYMVFTTIEQQLKDTMLDWEESQHPNAFLHSLPTTLKVIEQHKSDLFAKYNL